MEDKKIILERRRTTDYGVAHESLRGGSTIFYGARNGKPTRKEVTEELFDYLNAQTTCFKKGKLFVVSKEIREETGHEDMGKNSHTIEEATSILNSNTNTMKKKLGEITEKSEKDFFIEVAKAMYLEDKFDSSTKKTFLLEWAGINKEMESAIFEEKQE